MTNGFFNVCTFLFVSHFNVFNDFYDYLNAITSLITTVQIIRNYGLFLRHSMFKNNTPSKSGSEEIEGH